MRQDIPVGITLFAHDGGTYLAQAYAVPPSGSVQGESGCGFFHHEGGTVQVGVRKGFPDFQFFSYHDGFFAACDFESYNAPGNSAFQGFEVKDFAYIDAGASGKQFADFRLFKVYMPPVKIGCFLVVVVEYL